MCSIGALGLYLLTRFEVTDEIEDIDFSDNRTWFNRKLLKSMVGANSSKGNVKYVYTLKYFFMDIINL